MGLHTFHCGYKPSYRGSHCGSYMSLLYQEFLGVVLPFHHILDRVCNVDQDVQCDNSGKSILVDEELCCTKRFPHKHLVTCKGQCIEYRCKLSHLDNLSHLNTPGLFVCNNDDHKNSGEFSNKVSCSVHKE